MGNHDNEDSETWVEYGEEWMPEKKKKEEGDIPPFTVWTKNNMVCCF